VVCSENRPKAGIMLHPRLSQNHNNYYVMPAALLIDNHSPKYAATATMIKDGEIATEL